VVGALIYFAGIHQVALSVTLNSEFVGAGALGVPVYGTGRVVRDTKSMVFVQGQLDQEDQPILVFSSVARKITPRINVG
jgi:acyl-coenzyme A thioesterase PaaI-like protein